MDKLALIIGLCLGFLLVACSSEPVGKPVEEFVEKPTRELTKSTEEIQEPTEEPAWPPIVELFEEDETGEVVLNEFFSPRYQNPPSLDLQIFEADIVVIATLVSATPSTQAVGDRVRPGQVLQFRSSEYLKGTGPREFVVEVPMVEYEYSTQAAALEAARSFVANRVTTYDSRPGVLFLQGPLTAASLTQQSTTSASGGSATRSIRASNPTVFAFVPGGMDKGSWEYSIESKERVWMPSATSAGGSGGSGIRSPDSAENTNPEYITNGQVSPPTVVTLSDLKANISALQARLQEGENIEGFKDCVWIELNFERLYRHYDPLILADTMPSGADPGTQTFYDDLLVFPNATVYMNVWVEGEDASHFEHVLVDDDDDPVEYRFKAGPIRPLPEGFYEVDFRIQNPTSIPCDFRGKSLLKRELTVTAPAGILHEAFYDPVTVGTAVKADSSNGVLKPTSFTVGSTSTELTSLEWSSNQVVLTLGTHVSLSGHVLDFIELDGSVSLSLFTDSATVDSTAGTYTWSMSSQPWQDGDKLMFRLRPVGTEIFLQNLPSTTAQGTAHWFSAKLMNLDRSRSYSYSISADNRNVVLHNAMCTAGTYAAGDVPARSTSHSSEHPLLGCGTPGATITATLLEGTTEIDTTTYSVTVTPPPPPLVEFSELASTIGEGGNDEFVIIASHLDVAHGHTIRLTTDNANMGFNATCTDLDEEFTIGSGSAAYLNSSRLYGCAAPGGTVTATLLQGATTIGTFTHDVTVTPPPPPSLEFRNPPSTLESGQSATLRVRARELDTTGTYTVRVTTDNANMGFDSGCADRQEEDRADVGRTSFNTFFSLYGCAPPGGTVTATLLEGATAVNSISQAVTVTGPASTDATLSALALSGVSLTFDSATTSYTADVANSVAETTVTATADDDGATHVVKLGGVVDDDGTVTLAEGDNVITVEVTAEDSVTTQTYTITVTRAVAPTTPASTDATLSALTLSGVTLAFDSATTSYTADVANSVTETTVTATANDDGATHVVKLGGVVDDDGIVALAVGANVITVEVTADDGNTTQTQTYTVTVTRADAPLTATFEEEPGSHNGVDAFTLRISFSEAIAAGFATVRDHVLNVTGGNVTGARRVDGRSDLWEVTVQPDSTSDVVIVLPVTTDCTAQGAVCTTGNKPLSTRVELTVTGTG